MNIHVISTNYNSGNYCKNNILSIYHQTLNPKSHIFIDDVSEEYTRNILIEIKNSVSYKQINQKYKFDILLNKEKKFKIKNLYDQINKNTDLYDDNDIICIVDGDDWLFRTDALEKVLNSYLEEDLDYLYTNWVYSNKKILGCSKQIPDDKWNPYRDDWITSHLSTFKVKKFREISSLNFKDENDKWFEMGCDQAYILPILFLSRRENKSYKKVKYINEVFYVYQHSENPLRVRDGKLGKKAHEAVTLIRNRGFLE